MLGKIWDFFVVAFTVVLGVLVMGLILLVMFAHIEESDRMRKERDVLNARIEEGTTKARKAKEILLEYTGNDYVYEVKDVEANIIDGALVVNAVPKCYYNYSPTKHDVVIMHLSEDASDEEILEAKEKIRQKAIEVQQERVKKLENLNVQTNLTEK